MAELRIIDCEQNSEEWHKARLGMPTASAFQQILAKGDGRSRHTLMMRLAGEIITGERDTSWEGNEHTERGHAMEEEARELYAFQTGNELTQVGFITNGKVGCSPDRLIGDAGGLEVKTTMPHYLVEILLKNEVPGKHVAQIQGSLWITRREWWDIAIYWPKMPTFIKRVYRDEAYIQKLATEVEKFSAELHETVEKIRRVGQARAA